MCEMILNVALYQRSQIFHGLFGLFPFSKEPPDATITLVNKMGLSLVELFFLLCLLLFAVCYGHPFFGHFSYPSVICNICLFAEFMYRIQDMLGFRNAEISNEKDPKKSVCQKFLTSTFFYTIFNFVDLRV